MQLVKFCLNISKKEVYVYRSRVKNLPSISKILGSISSTVEKQQYA